MTRNNRSAGRRLRSGVLTVAAAVIVTGGVVAGQSWADASTHPAGGAAATATAHTAHTAGAVRPAGRVDCLPGGDDYAEIDNSDGVMCFANEGEQLSGPVDNVSYTVSGGNDVKVDWQANPGEATQTMVLCRWQNHDFSHDAGATRFTSFVILSPAAGQAYGCSA